ncbi:DNRLRE domain-containing protein [Clostridium sp. CF012]|uniref:DNRLRE domain-containing protein n=1 Tax=Clostridium sp. CF012 TaxID=2843319 RepID=UPI001C0DE873|nr:DNRLRE domain-containing protein [Clostridium sp. CF012]MBU3143972.1 DNRLRE domain-containing protein [Clostridium sp. CF012]
MATTNIIYDNRDAFVSAAVGSTTLNFGKDSDLFTGKVGSAAHKTLLHFDLSSIPANATITSAKLYLYVFRNDNTADATVDIKQLNSDFYEYKVTNATAPTSSVLVSGDTAQKTIAITDVGKVISFDNLTKTIAAWYADGITNHGFEVSGPSADNSAIGFWSREYSETEICPTLEIEYTVTSDIPDIETIVIPQQIQPLQSGAETTIYGISNDIFFNYLVDNDEAHFVYVTVKACDTRTGTFENIGSEISVAAGTKSAVEVSPIKKYVKLSVRGTDFGATNTINANAVYKTFANMVPSRIISGEVPSTGATMTLTMTKPLIGTTAATTAFAISSSGTAPTVTKADVSGTVVTLTLSAAIKKDEKITLTYAATGTSDLTGLNGEVNNFSNQAITNNSTQV